MSRERNVDPTPEEAIDPHELDEHRTLTRHRAFILMKEANLTYDDWQDFLSEARWFERYAAQEVDQFIALRTK